MSLITLEQIQYLIQMICSKTQPKSTPVSLTVPTSGWSTDASVSGYPYYYDVAVSGLSASDVVSVVVAPSSAAVAQAADFATVQSYTSKFRLRCASKPTTSIQAQYSIT